MPEREQQYPGLPMNTRRIDNRTGHLFLISSLGPHWVEFHIVRRRRCDRRLDRYLHTQLEGEGDALQLDSFFDTVLRGLGDLHMWHDLIGHFSFYLGNTPIA